MISSFIFIFVFLAAGFSYAGGAPLCAEERDALAFLEYVTGPLPAAEEKDWWHIGGTQHGIFAKRYSIAFAGYAVAAIGMRGDAEVTNRVGRILDNCVQRLLRRDVWAYSQSKSYWGRKPWAPDPCYRENVMYTGHLLQLLAFYEWFTHDRKYWDAGFDFVWKQDQKVHYTVQRLIDVTVEQMRENDSGGVTCEPGLLFFPCNNHPHYALRLFARLLGALALSRPHDGRRGAQARVPCPHRDVLPARQSRTGRLVDALVRGVGTRPCKRADSLEVRRRED